MKIKRLLYAARSYIIFFLLTSFVTTCSVILYMKLLMDSLGYEFTKVELKKSSILTFANVLFIALFFTLVDYTRRKITVYIPAKKIQKCLTSLTNGDYSARVTKIHKRTSNINIFDDIAMDVNRLAIELGGVEMLRDDFIASVSHEIKTPLAVIQNYSMLLSSPFLEEEKRQEYALIVGEQSRKLAGLVSDILRLNRIENQTIYPQSEEFDLSEEICSFLLSFEDVWTKKNINLSTDIEQGIMTKGDRDLMVLIWNNLFSNAFKFTPQDGEVRVTLKLYGNKSMLIVSDTGCGMNEETMRHIWDKFYQGDTQQKHEGNGLGLSMVKRVVSIFNGEIEVKSKEGKGSSFIVTLPSYKEE